MASVPKQILFSWPEIVEALFHSRGITSGLWRIKADLRFASVNSGPTDAEMMPSGVVGIEALTLSRVETPGLLVFDAGQVVGARKLVAAKKAPASAKPVTRTKQPKAAKTEIKANKRS